MLVFHKLSYGSLDTWRQKDRPGVRLDREGEFLSLLSMKASKHPSMGSWGRECSSLSCSSDWVKGKVRVSDCLSVPGKLRVVDKQQVREGQRVSSLRDMQTRSEVGVQALAPGKCSLLCNHPG